jgi:uncharacterized glyoxalase superfamily protein PhnB
MNDPMTSLYRPSPSIDPDPAVAARLRSRLRQLLLFDDPGGETVMTDNTIAAAKANEHIAWGPALTPYITVADARRAIDWYVTVFDGHRRGEPYVMDDGRIGHAEIAIGDAVLMISDPFADIGIEAPTGPAHSHSLHVQVSNVDDTVRRAAEDGAAIERQPTDEPYGRVATIVDPFGHRWMVNQPPPGASRLRDGDVGYISLIVPDDERAKSFYGSVLGWRFSAGHVERGWNVEDVNPMIGIGGGAEHHEAQICYKVSDIAAATTRVRDHGGRAGEPAQQPYGLLAECTDDQGITFHLWQPA